MFNEFWINILLKILLVIALAICVFTLLWFIAVGLYLFGIVN